MSEGNVSSPGSSIAGWFAAWIHAWDRFWFSATLPHTLAAIRICCGGMLAYVHVIWLSQIADFFGPSAWLSSDVVSDLHRDDWAWSWLWGIENLYVLRVHEALAILASLCMACGLLTRLAIPFAWWLTLMVCHRQTGALFGLDQVAVMLSMYLMFSNCGSQWSFDQWWQEKRSLTQGKVQPPISAWLFPASEPSVWNNIATRLIQLHLCVIYLFGGLSKMRGEMWYDGSAMWYTAVNYEYQSLDITWLGQWRFAIAALTAMTIFWETFYCATVWPKLTRPITLIMAVFVHGGIALALGMVTFGFIMIVANFAFVSPTIMQLGCSRLLRLGRSKKYSNADCS